ncbi:MAG: T9SS type A sorting domain-containing protein [Bacteroidales bacterium]|nr:MAG: T9SS type A sorting domain-containing protein [Bacteroidales bacterium]
MKQNILLLVSFFILAGLQAQNYLISFEGVGESSVIDSVRVENLTQATNLSLSGGESLRLMDILTNLKYQEELRNSRTYIYPNPVTDYATLEFDAEVSADYTIELFDLSGKRIVQAEDRLLQGRHTYRLYNLKAGIYTIRIKSSEYNYTGKVISKSQNHGITQIVYQGQSGSLNLDSHLKGTQTETGMQYTSGDWLRFTAYSGSFTTILTDVPDETKTITFDFADCTDGDNNSYPVVKIGTQLWMAHNLRTTRYNDGTEIPLVTDNNAWRRLETPGYSWYNNDPDTLGTVYGALYTWYAIGTNKLCPVGWHVPSREEWTVLKTYLAENGYGYEGSGEDIGKSLAATSGWAPVETAGVVGNDQESNNFSGFSALPGGFRLYDGTFNNIGELGYWWTSVNKDCYAYFYGLEYIGSNIDELRYEQETGLSVRCLKD